MVPQGDRSIRNIPVPKGHRRMPGYTETPSEPEAQFRAPQPRPKKRRGGKGFLFIALGVVVVCGIGGLLLSTLFAGATITVYPRTSTVTVPSSITASPNAPAGSLAYQTMTLTQSATTTVTASGTKQVSIAASGNATIYNDYSTADQPLVTNTRFEAPNGNIYRIHSAVTVPGATKAADGTLTPGSVAVTLYADAPGADYNATNVTFTIPGFQGDPKFSAFSAKADVISGGFVGAQPSIAPADLASAESTLQQNLQASLGPALTSQIPAGYVAVPGSLTVEYGDSVEGTADSSGNVPISQSGTATGVIIRASDLASAVAQQTVQGYNGEAVSFADIKQLSLAVTGDAKNVGPIQISLSGTPTLVWNYDPAALKNALVGKSKASFETIVQSFQPAITRAEAKVRPFWTSTFPSDPAKITIVQGTQK